MKEVEERRQHNQGSSLIVSWRIIASAATLTAIGAGAALVFVATARDAEALSTIALALAIIAFVIQIMVFIAQVFASNQQTARNEEIYAQMYGLLEGLKGTTQGTQETLNSHVGLLLQAATKTASETVQTNGDEGAFDPEAFQQRVVAEAKKVAQESMPDAGSGSLSSNRDAFTRLFLTTDWLRDRPSGTALTTDWSRNRPSSDVAQSPSPYSPLTGPDEDPALARLLSYPNEETGRPAFERLKKLTPTAQEKLRAIANNEVSARRYGGRTGIFKKDDDPFINELERHELVKRTNERDSDGSRLTKLTPSGRETARLLAAKGRPPEWLRKLSDESAT